MFPFLVGVLILLYASVRETALKVPFIRQQQDQNTTYLRNGATTQRVIRYGLDVAPLHRCMSYSAQLIGQSVCDTLDFLFCRQ